MDAAVEYFVKHPDQARKLWADFNENDLLDVSMVYDIVSALRNHDEIANYTADHMAELYKELTRKGLFLNVQNSMPVIQDSSPSFDVDRYTKMNGIFTDISDQDRVIFNKIGELGLPIKVVMDSLRVITSKVGTTPGVWKQGIYLEGEERTMVDREVPMDNTRVAWVMFQAALALHSGDERTVGEGSTEITRNGVTLSFDRDGAEGDPSEEDLRKFSNGIIVGGKRVEFVNHRGSTQLLRLLTSQYNITVENLAYKLEFSANFKIPTARLRWLGKLVTLIKAKPPTITSRNMTLCYNAIQLWMVDNWSEASKCLKGALSMDMDKFQRDLEIKLAGLNKVQTYGAYIDAIKLKDSKQHNERNKPVMEHINSGNAGGSNSLYETKRAIVLDTVVRLGKLYSNLMKANDKKTIVKASLADGYLVSQFADVHGLSIKNVTDRKHVLVEPLNVDLADQVILDLTALKRSTGLEKLEEYASLSPEELPSVLIFEFLGKHIPRNPDDLVRLLERNPFSNIVIYNCPGFHNSQFIAVATKYGPKDYVKKNPDTGLVHERVKVDQCTGTLMDIYVPEKRVVKPLPANHAKGEIDRAMVLFGAVAQHCETIIHEYYENGIVPPNDIVPQVYKTAFWAQRALNPNFPLKYAPYHKAGKVSEELELPEYIIEDIDF